MTTDMKKLILFFFVLLSTAHLWAQEITYYKDVEPIIQTKCTPCHQPGESAPFSLITYEDVAKRASFIKEVIQNRFMPPWKADNKYVHFANDRSLSQKEIDRIVQWVDNKVPKGNAIKNSNNSPKFIEGSKYYRKPDLVLKMTDSFHVSGDNAERFVIFKIPFELKDSENVEAIEFYSNNKKLIHHANYAVHAILDSSIDIYKTDSYINLTEDDRNKFDQYQPYRKSITYYGGWIPGASYESYPKRIWMGNA